MTSLELFTGILILIPFTIQAWFIAEDYREEKEGAKNDY